MHKKLKVLVISGGKGGVGKTFVAINLAVALAKMGSKVLLLDGDFGLSNIGISLNVQPEKTLAHLVQGEARLSDIWTDGPAGIKIITSFSGDERLHAIQKPHIFGIIKEIENSQEEFDYLVIDTAAGIPETIFAGLDLYQNIYLVVSQDPASIADCYATIKYLRKKLNLKTINLIANMGRNEKDAFLIYNKVSKVTHAFLDVHVRFSGYILFDEAVRKSAMERVALIEGYPYSRAAGCMLKIADKIRA